MSRQDLLVRSRLATGDIDARAAAKLCFQDPTRLQKYSFAWEFVKWLLSDHELVPFQLIYLSCAAGVCSRARWRVARMRTVVPPNTRLLRVLAPSESTVPPWESRRIACSSWLTACRWQMLC